MNEIKINKVHTIESWADALLDENRILSGKLEKILTTSELDSRSLLIETIKFLYLVSKNKVVLSPSLLVDLAWHELILFTRAYEQFCLSKLGRFIHHTPDDNKESNNRNFLKTIQYYIHTFGKPPKDIWGNLALSEWENSQCGSCNSN